MAVTAAPRALSQCGRTSDGMGPFAGLMERIMGKTSARNSEANPEVRELRDDELDLVSGGKQKPDGTAAGNVAAKWNLAQGAAA